MSKKKTSIGGQALIEGILMQGPDRRCIVIRKPDKTLEIKEEEGGTKKRNFILNLPLIRGPIRYWDAINSGVKALMYSAEFFEEDAEAEKGRFEKWLEEKIGLKKLEKILMTLSLVLGIALPIGLFILLPTLIAGLFGDGLHYMVRNLIEGAIRILIFIGFVWATSKEKDVKRTYMYHGAEHKTIACYENGMALTVENCRRCSRFHPRCGTSFLFVVMIVSILVFSVVHWSNPFVRMALRLLLLPVVAGISYEINRFAGRYDCKLTYALRAPGVWMQHLTTLEPDDSMIEVAIEALSRVIPEEENKDRW